MPSVARTRAKALGKTLATERSSTLHSNA